MIPFIHFPFNFLKKQACVNKLVPLHIGFESRCNMYGNKWPKDERQRGPNGTIVFQNFYTCVRVYKL